MNTNFRNNRGIGSMLKGITIRRGMAWGIIILGALVALFEFPCTGGPYLFVLTLLHDYANFWKGFWYLIL